MIRPLFTKKGFEDIKKEKEDLLIKRKHVVSELKRAREMGDLSENGFYKAAKFELGNVDRRLRQLTYFITQGKVMESSSLETIGIDCKIIVEQNGKEQSFHMVGGYESDTSLGKISHLSPLGKSLMGKKVSETIEILTPSGEKISYTIKKIE